MSMLGRSALPSLLSVGLLVACAVQVDTNAPIIPADGGANRGSAGDGSYGGSAGSDGSSGSAGDGGFGGVIGGPPIGGGGGDLGSSGSGNGGSGTACTGTQKLCGGMCVENGPTVGCTIDTCDPCPALWNAKSGCAEGACTITCNSGYVKEGNLCVAPGSGGSAGSGGSTGAGGSSGGAGGSGSCVPSSCPGCSVVGPFPCCNAARRCGCTWAPGAYCL
jgi:hypothetical protein